MKRAFFLSVLVAWMVSIPGCGLKALRPARSDLTLVYVSNLPDDPAGWAGLSSALKEIGEGPLVVVDDTVLSTLEDLAWWEGEKELFLLDTLGVGLVFPPSKWLFLGPQRLKELSDQADFFIVGLNLVDDSLCYPLSRYMIRKQGPYRVAFSAPVMSAGENLEGVILLPLDSILSATASFLRMQSDYFFVFDAKDSLPAGVFGILRWKEGSRMDLGFVTRSQFKLRERAFNPQPWLDIGSDPLSLWQAHADSLDGELLGRFESAISKDSLEKLVVRAAGSQVPEGTMIFLGQDFIMDSLPGGEISFGMMRRIMRPEIFFVVSIDDFSDIQNAPRSTFPQAVKWVLVPSSFCLTNEGFKGRAFKITGITSAQIVRGMFARNTPPVNSENK